MNIAVLMKPVLDCGVQLEIDDKTLTVAQKDQAAQWVVNPADRSALEVALDLKHSLGSASVHAVSYAPEERTEAVCYALARGADTGTLVFDDHALEHDASFASVVLATYMARGAFDIVLCGNESVDTRMACMAPFVAERLRVPHITQVVSLELSADAQIIIVHRRLEKGNREKMECPLPAVVAVDPMIASPRYASVYAVHNVEESNLERLALRALGLEDAPPQTILKKVAPPRPRPKRTFIPDAKLTAAERMKMIRSGGMTKKKKDADTSLSGSPKEVADGIFAFLRDKGYLG